MTKQFKVTVTVDPWHDDFVQMDFTVNARDDIEAIRSVNKAMKQLGIKEYKLFIDPIEYLSSCVCPKCFIPKLMCTCE